MRIVAWDIETTDLKALMGRILCSSFHVIASDKLSEVGKTKTFRIDRKPYKTNDPIDDSELARAIRDELECFNCIVTWNGKMFDAAFLNARLMQAGARELRPQFHCDLMYYAGGVSMRVGSRKLANVQKFFGLDDEKTDISWEQWNRAALGDKKAMREVVKHCEKDVEVLAQAYWRMIRLVKNLHR